MISDRRARSPAQGVALIVAVLVVVGCGSSRRREAMSDPYPALAMPRDLVSQLARNMDVAVEAIDPRSAIRNGRTMYGFARFSHAGERFQVLVAAKRRGDRWSLLTIERAFDFGRPRSGTGDLPLVQLTAGSDRVMGGFVDPTLDRVLVRDVAGRVVDVDDASDGEVLLLGGEGDQLQAIRGDEIRVATPLLPANLEVEPPPQFGDAARKAAAGFVRDAILDDGDAGGDIVDGIDPTAFVGPLRDLVATTGASDIQDIRPDWFGFRVYLGGTEATFRIDVYLTKQSSSCEVYNYVFMRL